jgi:hypothetical protein
MRGPNLHEISAEVLLCPVVDRGPAASSRLVDMCCQWCLVLEGVVLIAGVVVGVAIAEAVASTTLALGACALAGDEHRWLAATLLALLSLA